MTTQEILDILIENESRLFYAWSRDVKNEALKEAHAVAKKAVVDCARAMGIIK